ncbi:hypothetical protein, partial [Pseudomonas sp. 2995-3]|uniref:hypothetical protein n=1 Tax=Pseudomonas sp. 2995-3 TaxID=1712680 RepID=UPI000C6BD388
TEVYTTIIEAKGLLRYDITISNLGDTKYESDFDYPGHHPFGFEITIKPNDDLEILMEMEKGTSFKKMKSISGGGAGVFEANSESKFHIEYQIKEGVDFKKVEEKAYDGILL